MIYRLLHKHADSIGISASVICLVHCLALPVSAAIAPLVLITWMASPWFHLTLLFLVLPVATWALISGYLEHQDKKVLYGGLWGGSTLIIGSFIPELLHSGAQQLHAGPKHYSFWLEFGLMATGSLLLIHAHVKNFQQRLHSGHHQH
ncbi:MAG: MerC domain-containing protein [Gammaproteobacteria bacterium]